MPVTSAGVLAYRRREGRIEVLLAHPGGPLWAHKDASAWSIPKGLIEEDESPEQTARREFEEETGHAVDGPLLDLGIVRQSRAKLVHGFAVEMDMDPGTVESNTFELEWLPNSGKVMEFPEVDRVEWFDLDLARLKVNIGQVPLLDELAAALESS